MNTEQIEVVRRKLREKQREIWDDLKTVEAGWLHYTSPAGFRKIIETRQIWCTDIRDVNDPREGDHGQDVVRSVVRRKSVPKEFADKVIRSSDLFGLKRNWTIYVACFCSAGEQARMWEDYACQCTGSAIEFNYGALHTGAREGEKYALLPVLYDRSIQERHVEASVDYAIQLGREMNLPRSDRREFWFSEVAHALMLCAVRFKDPSWCQEHERRIVVFGGDGVTPFLANGKWRVAVDFDRDAVTRVITGKHSEANSNTDSIRDVLNRCGYASDLRISSATA